MASHQLTYIPKGEFDFILVGNRDGTLSNLPKALKLSGFSILVIGVHGMSLIKSPWIDASIVLSKNTQSQFLEELFNKEEILNNLIGTFLWSSDQIMREVAESDIPLELKLKILPVRNENYLDMIGSKIGQYEKMSALGIPYPHSQSLNSKVELVSSELTIQGKILAKGDSSGGGAQVRMFESTSKDKLALLSDVWFPVLLQQFVPAKHIGVEAYFRNGELVQWFYAIIDSDRYLFGPSMGRTYLVPESLDFLEHLEKIGKSADLDGFVNVSLLVNPDTGSHEFFEFDARPNIWHHIFIDFNVPFKDIWNKRIKFQPNVYLATPVVLYEPERLFRYFLERMNLIGATKVLKNQRVPKYGVAISSVFYDSNHKTLNIIKLIFIPIAPLASKMRKVLVMLKQRAPKSLKAWIEQSKVIAVLVKFLFE